MCVMWASKMKVEETHYEFTVNWREMANWHLRRSRADEISPKLRKFHREAYKSVCARLKKNNPLRSTGRNCAEPTQGKMKNRKYDSHCIVCKTPCFAPKGNFNAKRVTICGKKKCRNKRRAECQRNRRSQMVLKFTEKPSKHNSHVKASKTSRTARQNWKSGATLLPK